MLMLDLTGGSHKTATNVTLVRHRATQGSSKLVKRGPHGDTKNADGVDGCITAAAEHFGQDPNSPGRRQTPIFVD